MNEKLNKYLELLKNDYEMFLNFLKAKYPIFHNSNFFFRDFHYGVKRFLESKQFKITYPEAEILAEKLSEFLEEKEVFVRVNKNGWKINYPDFITSVPGDPL
ncbi:MAG: hypothetical protein ABI550_00345 [Ignavibacteriaceae bacterium]